MAGKSILALEQIPYWLVLNPRGARTVICRAQLMVLACGMAAISSAASWRACLAMACTAWAIHLLQSAAAKVLPNETYLKLRVPLVVTSKLAHHAICTAGEESDLRPADSVGVGTPTTNDSCLPWPQTPAT